MKDEILKRFVRYAKIETTSDLHQEVTPSTECQWDLLNLLVEELKDLGIKDIFLNEHGYLIARLESNFSELNRELRNLLLSDSWRMLIHPRMYRGRM